MKNYKRLTKWSDLGTLHIFDFVGKEILLCDISPLDTDNLAGRLAELEDKIESGELVDRDEYIDRLMAAKDISGMTDKELEFFAKHNAKVRKEAVKGVLLTMLERMDRLTGCGVPYHVKKFINDIAEENGVDLVEEEIEE